MDIPEGEPVAQLDAVNLLFSRTNPPGTQYSAVQKLCKKLWIKATKWTMAAAENHIRAISDREFTKDEEVLQILILYQHQNYDAMCKFVENKQFSDLYLQVIRLAFERTQAVCGAHGLYGPIYPHNLEYEETPARPNGQFVMKAIKAEDLTNGGEQVAVPNVVSANSDEMATVHQSSPNDDNGNISVDNSSSNSRATEEGSLLNEVREVDGDLCEGTSEHVQKMRKQHVRKVGRPRKCTSKKSGGTKTYQPPRSATRPRRSTAQRRHQSPVEESPTKQRRSSRIQKQVELAGGRRIDYEEMDGEALELMGRDVRTRWKTPLPVDQEPNDDVPAQAEDLADGGNEVIEQNDVVEANPYDGNYANQQFQHRNFKEEVHDDDYQDGVQQDPVVPRLDMNDEPAMEEVVEGLKDVYDASMLEEVIANPLDINLQEQGSEPQHPQEEQDVVPQVEEVAEVSGEANLEEESAESRNGHLSEQEMEQQQLQEEQAVEPQVGKAVEESEEARQERVNFGQRSVKVEPSDEDVIIVYPQQEEYLAANNVDWCLPRGCGMDYRNWTISQMAEWVQSVVGDDTVSKIIVEEKISGRMMKFFLEEKHQKRLNFSGGPWLLLEEAATIMLNYSTN